MVLFAVSLSALCLCLGLAIDLGNVAQTHAKGQNAVDDAAISGADLLASGSYSTTQVVSTVETYVNENFAPITSTQWNSCSPGSVPSGFSAPAGSNENCITFNAASTVVNVALPPQMVRYTFGRVGGLLGTTIALSAAAMSTTGTGACVLCLLGPSGTTLSVTGNGSFTVTNDSSSAGIAVDSNSTAAGSITGSGTIQANGTGSPQINVVGGTQVTGSGSFSPTPHTGASSTPDPLGGLATPSVAGTPIPTGAYSCTGSTCPSIPTPNPYGSISVTGSGGVTIPPGTYSRISLTGNGNITFEPGSYVMTGPFSVTGNGTIGDAGGSSSGVFLYFTCSSGSVVQACASAGQGGGSISLTGNGAVDLSPESSGTYAGLTMFYDRNNTSPTDITGNGGLELSGTVYAKSSTLNTTGNGGEISSMIIVRAANVTGNASIAIDYNASTNISLPGSSYLCSIQAGNCS